MRSLAAETGERDRKYSAVVPAALPAGIVTSAYTSTFAPAASAPVLVTTALPASRNVTVQPAGSVSAANVGSVLAERSKLSAVPLLLLTYSVKRVVVPGFVAFVITAATSGPAPAPGAAPPGLLFVRSTAFGVIAVSTSVAIALTSALATEVACLSTWNGPPTAPGGSVACNTTPVAAPAATG